MLRIAVAFGNVAERYGCYEVTVTHAVRAGTRFRNLTAAAVLNVGARTLAIASAKMFAVLRAGVR